MRKANSQQKRIKAYKFAAQPVGELPIEFWRVAKAMRDLWNQFVDMREAKFEALKVQEDELKQKNKLKKARELRDRILKDFNTLVIIRDEKSQAWRDFNNELLAHIRSDAVKSVLNWECREMIYDRFCRASIQVAKALREWKAKKGQEPNAPMPTVRKRFGLDKILIPHRYTGGGKPISKVMQYPSRSKTFGCRPVGEHAYQDNTVDSKLLRVSRGVFGVGDTEFAFRVNLHREIPPDAIVKTLTWNGEFTKGIGWRWWIIFTVELPDAPKIHTNKELMAGLDVGWRKMGDYLRIGVIYDTTGNSYEIKLPLGITKREDNSVDLLEKYQRQMDERKDAMKQLLLEQGYSAKRVTKMGKKGLLQVLRELQESQSNAALQTALEEWKEWDWTMLGKCNNLRKHFEGRRRWLYENIAHELCRTYKVIVLEDELNLKKLSKKKKYSEMSEQERRSYYALTESKPFMRAASLYLFRQILKRIAASYETEIVDGITPFSTRYCHQHDAFAEPSAKLMLECPAGHKFDQDVNAGKNLLSCASALPTKREAGREWLQKLPKAWQVISAL
jgi:hypothetical protein